MDTFYLFCVFYKELEEDNKYLRVNLILAIVIEFQSSLREYSFVLNWRVSKTSLKVCGYAVYTKPRKLFKAL